jgi:electron transfer flavoprotein alpha/beta subunit
MMRVAAVVERAWDPASIEVDPVDWAVEWSRAVAEPSPGSLEAVELALRLGAATACGIEPAEPALRRALAMGASCVRVPDQWALAVLLAREAFDLVLVSWRAGDQSPSPLGPWLAGQLDLPQATAVDEIRVEGREAVVRRRLDRGEHEELAVPLPAVIAVEPGIVAPRTASPAAAIAAQSAEIAAEPPAPRPSPQPLLLGLQPPRPAPPRVRPPDPGLSAEARIAEVIGTETESRQRELATGEPAELAARIVRLLEDRGYLSRNRA